MSVIHKYQIDIGQTLVGLPEGYKILKTGIQQGNIMIWAEVEPERLITSVVFNVIGTGWEVPEGEYIDSVFIDRFVWHVFVA